MNGQSWEEKDYIQENGNGEETAELLGTLATVFPNSPGSRGAILPLFMNKDESLMSLLSAPQLRGKQSDQVYVPTSVPQ